MPVKVKSIAARGQGGRFISPKQVQKAVDEGYAKLAALTVEGYEKTTSTWDNKPTFTIKITRKGFTVTTTNAIYIFVDEGTRPHRIMPRRPDGVLRFNAPFRAKTRPGSLSSGSGGSGPDTVYSRGVNHPGSKARGFTEGIQKRIDKVKAGIMQAEIDKVVK
jgi:hypothetical protein